MYSSFSLQVLCLTRDGGGENFQMSEAKLKNYLVRNFYTIFPKIQPNEKGHFLFNAVCMYQDSNCAAISRYKRRIEATEGQHH